MRFLKSAVHFVHQSSTNNTIKTNLFGAWKAIKAVLFVRQLVVARLCSLLFLKAKRKGKGFV
jgi:hypothetical protein